MFLRLLTSTRSQIHCFPSASSREPPDLTTHHQPRTASSSTPPCLLASTCSTPLVSRVQPLRSNLSRFLNHERRGRGGAAGGRRTAGGGAAESGGGIEEYLVAGGPPSAARSLRPILSRHARSAVLARAAVGPGWAGQLLERGEANLHVAHLPRKPNLRKPLSCYFWAPLGWAVFAVERRKREWEWCREQGTLARPRAPVREDARAER